MKAILKRKYTVHCGIKMPNAIFDELNFNLQF